MRAKLPDTLFAIALPANVLPTPGTSSNRMCSPESKATTQYRTTWGFPRMTWDMFCSKVRTALVVSLAKIVASQVADQKRVVKSSRQWGTSTKSSLLILALMKI